MSEEKSPAEQKGSPDLEFLGQKFYFPNTILKLIGFGVLLVCATIVCLHLIDRGVHLSKTKDGYTFMSGNVTESNAKLKKGVIIGFWTQSDNTVKGLNMRADSAKYCWETNEWQRKYGGKKDIDSLNVLFWDEISKEFGFRGCRRNLVIGEGDSKLKEGWWWSIGFDGTYDEQFLKNFKRAYIKFWCPGDIAKDWDKLYMEVIGNSRDEEEKKK